MTAALLHTLVLALTLSCQQAERRDETGEVGPPLPGHVRIVTSDETVRRAEHDIDAGHPWRASRRLAPVVAATARATAAPEAVLVAARAASAWRGWSEVERLLAQQPWLDSRFGGEGLELLARAALEADDANAARGYAARAVAVAPHPATRAVRTVLLARALDRLDSADSAGAMYARAAPALTAVREWLFLRAAGATADAERRRQLYASIQGEVTKPRVPYTEAQALERFGPAAEAAAAYERLDDTASALRLRITAAPDEGTRASLRAPLVTFIGHARGDELRRALEVLDGAFAELDARTQLEVSRRASAVGVVSRAATGFGRVPAASLTDADVIAWANALIATGRSAEAARRLAAHRFGSSSAPHAAFLRGRALIRAGSATAGKATLTRLATTWPSSPYAADAQYLLADLAVDAGNERTARDLYARACRHVPAAAYSDDACFRSGIVSFALEDYARSARAFDEALKRFPRSGERVASLYWSGRAWQHAGNMALAGARWGSVLATAPTSYYASLSARRAGETAWMPSPRALPTSTTVAPALVRAELLGRIGMTAEQRMEFDAIESDASANTSSALGTGTALLDRGESVRAMRIARALIARGAEDSASRDDRAYLLLYPVLHRDEILAASRVNHLDPALVAAVIRQESSWYPRAVSVAGARGLMQLMPSVGRQIARARGYPIWDPALLFDPDVSLELGTAHLRAALREESSLARALAAYNAGGSRVRRWVRRAGASDPELFIERIPFVETRDYVRIVLRNAEVYRALYGWRSATAP